MHRKLSIAIISDIHYAGAAERQRGEYCLCHIGNPIQRIAVRMYRHYFWMRDGFAHNALLDEFTWRVRGADLAVANGDYSCDSAFVGVSDDAACSSADECLQKLRADFGANLLATIGDHELGKKPLGANIGGPRLESFTRTGRNLALPALWKREEGNYVLVGMTSSLAALPLYAAETLPEEQPTWLELHQQHLQHLRELFAQLRPYQRVLLFCHDPSALPFLWREKEIREKLPQVERTVIGHLHSNIVMFKSRMLAGCPPITFMGHTVRRVSAALREARVWRHFNVLLCPSLAGIELLKDGGFFTAELDLTGTEPAVFKFHRLQRK